MTGYVYAWLVTRLQPTKWSGQYSRISVSRVQHMLAGWHCMHHGLHSLLYCPDHACQGCTQGSDMAGCAVVRLQPAMW